MVMECMKVDSGVKYLDDKQLFRLACQCVDDDNNDALCAVLQHISEPRTKSELLVHAVERCRHSCIRSLLDHGANPYLKLNDRSSLYHAVAKDDVEAVKLLTRDLQTVPSDAFNNGAVISIIPDTSLDDSTPLSEHTSAANYSPRLNHSLPATADAPHRNHPLPSGRYLTNRTAALNHALLEAATHQRTACIKYLLDCDGVDVNVLQRHDDEILSQQCTPLMACCFVQNSLPITDAQESNCLEIVRLLVEEGRADVNVKNYGGDTALIFAAIRGLKRIVRFLVENGANVNDKGRMGKTALMNAVNGKSENALEIAQILIDARANVNEIDSGGWSLLYGPVVNENLPLVELLLCHGANPNIASSVSPADSRRIPSEVVLYPAVCSGNLPLIRLLIRWGANVNHPPHVEPCRMMMTGIGLQYATEVTPFRRALEVGNMELAQLLLIGGYDRKVAKCEVESVVVEIEVSRVYGMLNVDTRVKQRMLEGLHEELFRVRSLREECRFVVRGAVRDVRSLEKLGLPEALVSFLQMDDI